MRMKLDDFDEEELENAEWEDREDFETYDGPMPRHGTKLPGRIEAMWITRSSNDDHQLVVLFRASTEGDDALEEYDGCQIWDRVTFTPTAAFHYQPFLAATGISLRDIRAKLDTEEDEGKLGYKINQAGSFVPGSDEATVIVKVRIQKDEGFEPSVKVGKYLPASDGEEDAPRRPSRQQRPAARRPASNGTPPRRTAAKAPVRRGGTSRDPWAGDDEDVPF